METLIENEYFEWLMDLSASLCPCRSYQMLFEYLYSREFYWNILKDSSRAEDGINLRLHFAAGCLKWSFEEIRDVIYRQYPCSVLEMMVALAQRCEGEIMGNSEFGDRTGLWFNVMLESLHIDGMTDDCYDQDYVETAIDILLDHQYDRNGDGGLFALNDPPADMRRKDIWLQMCWYLSENGYDS